MNPPALLAGAIACPRDNGILSPLFAIGSSLSAIITLFVANDVVIDARWIENNICIMLLKHKLTTST